MMNKIFSLYPNYKILRLGINEGGVFNTPTVVTTVLGSCVSVVLFCREYKTGGVFHSMFPTAPRGYKENQNSNKFKYVDSSINYIVNSFNKRGIENNQIEAKVFGGAQTIPLNHLNTGHKNIAAAYNTLAIYKIRIKASDIGGKKGRNLIFISDTGEIFIKNHKANFFETRTSNIKSSRQLYSERYPPYSVMP